MILVGIVLILLGSVFLFAGLTGTPRAVLGAEKETRTAPAENAPPPDHSHAQTSAENPSPETSQFEFPPPVSPEDQTQSPPAERPGSVYDAPLTPVPSQQPPDIPFSRRLSSIVLGIIGVAFGILAVLDSL